MSIKSKQVYFNVMDTRTVRVTGGTKSITAHKDNDKIVSLELPNSKLFSIGDTMTINNQPYKINIIEKMYGNDVLFYEFYVAKKTKSTLLIMPMLGSNKKLFFYNNFLINCFVGTKEDGIGSIVLLYRWSKDPRFLKFEAALKQFRNFIGFKDISDNFILFEFKVPTKYKKDYKTFIDGKYSKLSTQYKNQILKFNDAEIDSQIAQILYKSERRRNRLEHSLGITLDPDAELFSVIDLDLELFDKNYYL
tara:strand:- start:1164 stop:1910 length:747 start_codon:yes stop_codon:yes gene_type:complete